MNWLELLERFGVPVFMLGVATVTLWRFHIADRRRLEARVDKLEARNEYLETQRAEAWKGRAEDTTRVADLYARLTRENIATIRGLEKNRDR